MNYFIQRTGLYGLLLSCLVLLSSCREEKKDSDSEPSRMEAVLAVHDEVMPRMGELGKLVAQLKPLADSTEAGQPYKEAMEDLQAAHTAMMDWMKGFGDRFDHSEVMKGKALSAQKKEWLREEEVKVKAMRDQVLGSIERAKSLLGERDSIR